MPGARVWLVLARKQPWRCKIADKQRTAKQLLPGRYWISVLGSSGRINPSAWFRKLKISINNTRLFYSPLPGKQLTVPSVLFEAGRNRRVAYEPVCSLCLWRWNPSRSWLSLPRPDLLKGSLHIGPWSETYAASFRIVHDTWKCYWKGPTGLFEM